MAEKIRPLHLPPTSTPSQQPLLVPSSSPDGSAQHGMPVPKPQPQQVPGHHPQAQGSGQPDIALHARPASSSGPGIVFICRPGYNASIASTIKNCPVSEVGIVRFFLGSSILSIA